MKISIIGTRGIPNNYGGFEQFADILSQGLVEKGHEVIVYCSANHDYKGNDYKGVKLIHKYDPENKVGTVGQFIYDLNCMLDARKRGFDIIYMLGYTSSSIWQRFIYKKRAIVVTNMDGLEWKRSKYSKFVQNFLKYAEKLAVKYSDYLISDSIGIQKYLKEKYKADSSYFPYGSFVFKQPDENLLKKYKVEKYNYDILIARFEPENNIEIILEAYHLSESKRRFILIGNYSHTDFGRKMYDRYSLDKRIQFLGAVYNQDDLNNLRYFSNLYFHGHSVGGTNPSLLEAMGSFSLICFHNNDFNKAIIGNDGFAFNGSHGLKKIIEKQNKIENQFFIENNIKKIQNIYKWEIIIEQYEKYFSSIIKKDKNI